MLKWPELQKHLATGRPAVLGVYANLMMRASVIRIPGAAPEAVWKTVVGGPEPGAYLERYLAAGADVVVISEGEVTLEELLPILRSGALDRLRQVNAIAFRASPLGDPLALRGRRPQFDESSSRSVDAWQTLKKTPHPAPHGRHPLPCGEGKCFCGRAPRAYFSLSVGEGGRGTRSGEGFVVPL